MTGKALDQADFLFASDSGTDPIFLRWKKMDKVQFGVPGFISPNMGWVLFFVFCFFLKLLWELTP